MCVHTCIMCICIIVLLFQLTVVGTHIPHCNVSYRFVCVIAAYKNRLYDIPIVCYGVYYLFTINLSIMAHITAIIMNIIIRNKEMITNIFIIC